MLAFVATLVVGVVMPTAANADLVLERTFGGTFPSSLGTIKDLAIDSQGRLFLADSYDRAIKTFSSDGTYLSSWAGGASEEGPALNSITGVAVDAQDQVYVADAHSYSIWKYADDGTLLGIASPAGGRDARDVAVDSEGYIYVLRLGGYAVRKYSPTGEYVSEWGPYGSDDGQFFQAEQIAVAPDDSVYVTDRGLHRVQRFSADGTFLAGWGSEGTAPGQFNSPRGIAVDPAGNVYVADGWNDRVQVFTAGGIFVRTMASDLPSGLAANASGHLFASELDADRVVEFDATGAVVDSWGQSRGTADGEVPNGAGLDVATDGTVYVADAANGRVQQFTGNGAFLRKTEPGLLEEPTDVDAGLFGQIWVADLWSLFRLSSPTLAYAGSYGSGYGDQAGVATDSGGSVLFTTPIGDEVTKFAVGGESVTWGGFGDPRGIATDSDGFIYVTETAARRVTKLRPNGELVRRWGTWGPGNGQFEYPSAIEVDSRHRVWVADPGRGVVQRFSRDGTFLSSMPSAANGLAAGDGSLYLNSGVIEKWVETDSTPPDTSLPATPDAVSSSRTALFSLASNEPGSTFECRLNTGEWEDCSQAVGSSTSSREYTDLADGEHVFSARASDTPGNVDPTPVSHAFVVDTDPPDTEITSGPPSTSNDATPEFAFDADEADATFECRLDAGASNGTWSACASGALAPLADGSYVLNVRAVDRAAHVDATPATRSFVIDTVAPETTIDASPTTATNNPSPELAFSSPENSALFECRLIRASVEPGAWAPCIAPYVPGPLADGEYAFEVRAGDAAGNRDATPPVARFRIDTSEPDTEITTRPPDMTSARTAVLTFRSADTTSVFECSLDQGPFQACASPVSLSGLALGKQSFHVRAVDAAGNADPSPAAAQWTVTSEAVTPPAVPPEPPPPGTAAQQLRVQIRTRVRQRLRAGAVVIKARCVSGCARLVASAATTSGGRTVTGPTVTRRAGSGFVSMHVRLARRALGRRSTSVLVTVLALSDEGRVIGRAKRRVTAVAPRP